MDSTREELSSAIAEALAQGGIGTKGTIDGKKHLVNGKPADLSEMLDFLGLDPHKIQTRADYDQREQPVAQPIVQQQITGMGTSL